MVNFYKVDFTVSNVLLGIASSSDHECDILHSVLVNDAKKTRFFFYILNIIKLLNWVPRLGCSSETEVESGKEQGWARIRDVCGDQLWKWNLAIR